MSSEQVEQGRALYVDNCGSCHGPGARGDGVVARVLTTPIPDLSTLRRRHGGAFPTDLVFSVIDGRAEIVAHGDRLMPVWGTEFWLDEGADERGEVRAAEKIHALIAYLDRLQRE